MSRISLVFRARTWAKVWPTMLALSSTAAFDENEVGERHVVVNVYAGDELARTAIGVVIGTGVVLTDAETVSRGRRHSIVSATGAEIAAVVTHTGQALSLAVLRIPGLDQPGLPFALREVGAEENRFVHAVAYDREATSATQFVFRNGSISAADEARVRRSGKTVAVYRHNARLDATGFGGSLLNNCGELVGINRPDPSAGGVFGNPLRDPVGTVYASRIGDIERQLDEWEVEYLKSDHECLSEAQSAAVVAQQKASEAQTALRQFEEAKRREQDLAAVAAAARQEGDAARADAEAAQSEAAAVVEAAEAERKAAEGAAEAAREAATIEAEKLQRALAEAEVERERRDRQWQTVWLGATAAAALALGLIAFLWIRNRRKSHLVVQARAKTAAAERELAQTQAGVFPDVMLEGPDDEGIQFALKIPGSGLHAGVDGVVVGRSPGRSTFVLDHPSISREHCRLRLVQGILHVEDLHATNGVLLNGNALRSGESCALREGDRVTLGTVELTLRFL